MITVSIDTKPRDLRKMVDKLGRTFTKNHKRAMRRAAAEGLNRIQKRTSKSLDVNNQPFKPYSKTYDAFRKRRPKKGESKPVFADSKVRLIFSNRMRKSMQSGLKGEDGFIFFDSRTESKKAAMNNKTRKFFGLNKNDTRAIRDVYFKGLKI